ncbi:MAG: hypothetical protein ACRDT4_24810 [Micromonosporaceae bacterium]
MNTAVKLGGFALALVAVFGGTYGIGKLVGPVTEEPPQHEATTGGGHGDGGHDAGGDQKKQPAADLPGGLMVSDRGYTVQPVTAPRGEFAFRITGSDGHPVTRFDVEHDKQMHLVVVRRDLAGFRHVHPTMAADGTWTVKSPLGAPGTYRAYADFTPTGGEGLTLGMDVNVAGAFAPRPLPEPAAIATVDGYTVRIDGTLEPGRTSKLTLTVSRDGKPVTDLQPYLAAYGHLVALRQYDLAYLHVHPDGEPGDGKTQPGPGITFYAEVPSAGSYRLYLDFRHGDVVRTAEFTIEAGSHD